MARRKCLTDCTREPGNSWPIPVFFATILMLGPKRTRWQTLLKCSAHFHRTDQGRQSGWATKPLFDRRALVNPHGLVLYGGLGWSAAVGRLLAPRSPPKGDARSETRTFASSRMLKAFSGLQPSPTRRSLARACAWATPALWSPARSRSRRRAPALR